MSLWKTAPVSAFPFIQDMESAPNWSQLILQTGHPECGHPPVVQLCPSEGVVLGPSLHWESPPEGRDSPPAHPTGVHRHWETQHLPAHRQAEEDVVSEQGATVCH